MNSKIDFKTYTTIKVLSKSRNTNKSIKKELLKENVNVSLRSIYNVLKCNKKRFREFEYGVSEGSKPYSRNDLTPSLNKKYKQKLINSPSNARYYGDIFITSIL